MLSTLISAILVINEMMASNVGEVMSPATDFDSWIEVYNPGEEVSLGGMYLSNDRDNLTLWRIPESVGSVPANGFKVLWLGSNDIRTDQAPFKLDCDGGSIYLSDANGTLIDCMENYPSAISHTSYARTTDGGDEWGWTATPTPEATNETATFASQRLDLPTVSVGSKLFTGTLNVKVDIPEGATLMYTTDGSVPTPPRAGDQGETPEEDPTWTDWIINGDCEGEDATCFVCQNGDGIGDDERITSGVGVDGSCGIKVHAVNNPAHNWTTQFFVYTPDYVWKQGDHIRFSMKVRADRNAKITMQSHTTPGKYIYWQVLCNEFYVTDEWQTLYYDGYITSQQVHADGNGELREMQTIAFNLNEENYENNYYFDDIEWQLENTPAVDISVRDNPGMKSENGEFTINGTTNFCFRLFKDGYLPSVPVTRSYIQTDNDYTLPVISIVGDPKYFTDPMWGIDVDGMNGISGNGSNNPVNWNQPWDRPVNFSYMNPEGEMLFNQDVNIEVSGGWTRSQRFRSFKLKSNKVFDGKNKFDYPFFPQKPYIRSKTLLVRNGGNDVWTHNARFMDPALETIIQRSGIDIDVQSCVPVIEYVNGQLRGVLNIREPNNDKFAYANWGYDDEELDAFENLYMKNGTDEVINRIFELGRNINDEGAYDELKTLLDIDEFTNYMAATMFLDNDDWPDNNIKGYRSRNDGRYRFVSFDLDYAFALRGDNNTGDNPFAYFERFKDNGNRNQEIVNLFLHLLGHDEFRRKFIDTFCLMGGSVFEPTRAGKIVDELLEKVQPMCELMRQQGINDGHEPYRSAKTITDKLSGRSQKMAGHMKDFSYLNLSGATPQAVTFNTNTPGAHILLNGIDVPYADFKGYLFQPVTLEAVAPAGYRFAGWTSSSASPTLSNIISTGEQWKYYDQGEADSDWKSAEFNDDAWGTEKAPLGYNMDGVVTTISYGSDSNNKNPTSYFRKTVQIVNTPTDDDEFQLNYQLDDGFVIYVNGQEAGRVNMRQGTIEYGTYASAYAEKVPLTGTLKLTPSLFKEGTNVIAVEVHNNQAASSDLFWDCELLTTVGADNGESVTNDPVIDLPNDETVSLTANFVPLTAEMKADQYITPVRINEVSADDGIYVNEYFKRTDWVELYNTTDQPIDVEGMFLTDNLDKPDKYKITKGESAASTIIPAHGYLIVWCDKKDPLSQLHASFKIGASGDDLMLTAADGSWRDILSYPTHKSDQTVGRFPDGSNNVCVMNRPTIAKPNITSSYVTDAEQPYQPDPASFAAGDANGDSQVNIADVTYIVSYLKGSRPVDFRFSAADVDHDGFITVADLKYVTNKLLGKE